VGTPSTSRVRIREAGNLLATSVVPSSMGSWRSIITPSWVSTRSGSMKSAPCSMAAL
jgi:hypothetical protein